MKTWLISSYEKMDNLILKIGHFVSWLNLLLLFLILLNIILRYTIGRGFVFIEELQWYLYSAAFMVAISFAQVKDSHIRLDILREHFKPRTQEIVELLGIIFLVLPFIFVLFDHGLNFAVGSWKISESSGSPMGLPYRWIVKSIIPISMLLLSISIISRMIKVFTNLTRRS